MMMSQAISSMVGSATDPTNTARPMIDEGEVQELIDKYGAPVRRTYFIQADEYIRSYRWQPTSDRRAEVVFAIQNPASQIWLHAKAHYPARIYRLLSGGIHPEEGVEEALWREIAEETSLECRVERFLGLVTYHFTYGDEVAHFASYIFTLAADFTQPRCERDNEISAFCAMLPSQLRDVSNDLRNLIGDRHGWGQWRALAVDLVHEQLTGA
jgi:ADP-ribose pyrophosphatase YjhB (NUDIX family)